MSIKDRWNNLTTNEKLLIGMIILLLIMVATRWDKITKQASEAFNRYFGQ
ncbi:hypothetical protein CYCD_23340 [Tenuifilaceae bacterium CYCD]|nr:hypothetical protein CYCD_23340 [Tenuifilaceae bacterium CYCD]